MTDRVAGPDGSALSEGLGPNAQTVARETEVPDNVQEALATVLNAQFELGFKAGTRGRSGIFRKDCLPMNDALKALVREIRAALDAVAADRDGLMQSLRDEMDENLRLRELGGALPDENITAMTERVIAERAALLELVAELRQALRMVDDNHRVDEGEKRKAWSGRFVVEEVRRVLALGPNVRANRETTR